MVQSFGEELPSPDDLVATWAFLEEGINQIMNHMERGFDYQRFMSLYTTIYNYSTSCKSTMAYSPSGRMIPRTGATFMGGDLYRNLTIFIQDHLKNIVEESQNQTSESLLRFYARKWSRYTIAAGYVHHVFQYLNRHWIKRGIEEGHKNVFEVYILSLVSWRDHFFMAVQHKVTASILMLIEQQRNGGTIESDLIRTAIESYVAVGMDEAEPNKTVLDIYQKYFETPFIEATEAFYRAESKKIICEHSVPEYMKKAETRLKEEENRVKLYLHQSTLKNLKLICENVLIKEHIGLIQDEFQGLLDAEKHEDLHRLHSLLSRIPHGLAPLRNLFESHVRRAGLTSIDRILHGSNERYQLNSRTYITTLLEAYNKYLELVQTAFSGDPGFVASLDRACREYINRNKVSRSSSAKSPELLARYCDLLLRKSSKLLEDREVEDRLNDAMIVFKYVEDKDVFQKFYSKLMARRLVNGISLSEDVEINMISKLKEFCGYEYTSKLQRMFTDITLSRGLNEQFQVAKRARHEQELSTVDFYINVLGTSAWPLNPPATPFNIPEEVINIYHEFQTFYLNKYSGRKLNLLSHLCKAELVANYLRVARANYTFQVSFYQMGILLQYNVADVHSYEDLAQATALNLSDLDAQLRVLCKTRVLLLDQGAQVGDPGSQYRLNFDYRSRKIKINLNLQAKTEVKAEASETHRTISEDRTWQIRAAVVRIMKTRKRMRHVALMNEVLTQLRSSFIPPVQDIKKCIDFLLESEYIERVSGQYDMYSYVA
ncbi:uncharacterized protein VTP21DRAFT_2935 [Calcarisporiella thermophila]|uniref:uncharacterized protein n=1 Tax=Calcarisporiella thermophila TaxID=911321 RepID=UPI0037424180